MYNVGIVVPIYHHEEDVAKLLMKLTQLDYTGINPTLYLTAINYRESFYDDFLYNYIERYDKRNMQNTSPLFDGIVLEEDDSSFNPSDLINRSIHENSHLPESDFIFVIEPTVGVEDTNILKEFIQIYEDYDFKRQFGAICSDNKQHKIAKDHLIRWFVDDYAIMRSLDGDGFGNG